MQSDKPSKILGNALRKTGAAGGVLLAFGFVVNLLYLATPLYMMQLFDRVLASQRLETLVALTLIAVFALAVLGALETVRGRIATRTSEWLDETLGRHVIDASVSAAVRPRRWAAPVIRAAFIGSLLSHRRRRARQRECPNAWSCHGHW